MAETHATDSYGGSSAPIAPTCDELAERYRVHHCMSCHNDEDEGYASLSEIEVEGQTIGVCCTVSLVHDGKREKLVPWARVGE